MMRHEIFWKNPGYKVRPELKKENWWNLPCIWSIWQTLFKNISLVLYDLYCRTGIESSKHRTHYWSKMGKNNRYKRTYEKHLPFYKKYSEQVFWYALIKYQVTGFFKMATVSLLMQTNFSLSSWIFISHTCVEAPKWSGVQVAVI